MKKLLSFLIALIFTVGCKTVDYQPPKQYNFTSEFEYSLPYDYVWEKVIRFFGETGIPVKNMDKASGFIATEVSSFSGALGQFLDCGAPGSHTFSYGKFVNPYGYFNVIVSKISEGVTRVKVKTFYKVYYEIYSYDWNYNTYLKSSEIVLNCNSTGLLESLLLAYIVK